MPADGTNLRLSTPPLGLTEIERVIGALENPFHWYQGALRDPADHRRRDLVQCLHDLHAGHLSDPIVEVANLGRERAHQSLADFNDNAESHREMLDVLYLTRELILNGKMTVSVPIARQRESSKQKVVYFLIWVGVGVAHAVSFYWFYEPYSPHTSFPPLRQRRK